MDVQATGTGFAIVQLSCNCFVLEDNKSPSFAINLSFDGSCDNYLKFEICLNYIPKSKTDISSNMVIVEIHLPSGYQSDNNGEKSKNIDVGFSLS